MTTPTKASVDFDKLNDMITSISTAAKKMQFQVAGGEMQALLTAYPGAKSSLRILKNTLTSISEGLRDKELTRKGAELEVKMAVETFEEAIHKSLDSLSQPSKYDPDVLYKDLSKETLKIYDKDMNGIQTQLNRNSMFVGYAPVLPITAPALDVGKLKAAGIAAENFAGYCVLKKQFVAGITNEALRALAPKTIEPGMSQSKVRELELAALEHFKEIILAKYRNLKLVQMGEQAGWWNGHWLWFATASEFKLMKSCTTASTTVQSLKIQKWNFPFHRGD